MAEPNRQADALLTEHFRYTPLSLIDEIINAVNTIIYRAIEAIENGLFSIPPSTLGFDHGNLPPTADGGKDEIAKVEIENGVHQLETLLEATVDKTFDKFEIYTLRNILTVPDELTGWIRLAHYENLTLPLPPNAPTPESILHLRRQLAETKKLNRALQTTHASNLTLLTSLSTLLSPPLDPNPNPNPTQTPTLTFLIASHPPLTTQAHFTTSQLPSVRHLLTRLRPRLQSLRSENLKDVDRDRRSGREERRAYLEQRVRRAVKGGVDVVGGGERKGEEEVRGLEEVVGGLGGDVEMGG